MFLITLGLLIILSILINGELHLMKILTITCLIVGLEQLSKWGIDNLTVPIGVAISWGWLSTV